MIPPGTVPGVEGNPGAAYANNTIYAAANSDFSGIPTNVLIVLAQYAVTCCNNPASSAAIQFIISLSSANNTYINALDASNGCIKWTNEFLGATFASLTHANGIIYTGNFNGVLRALDADTGALLFESLIPGGPPASVIGAPITVTEGRVFVGTGVIEPAGGLFVYGLP